MPRPALTVGVPTETSSGKRYWPVAPEHAPHAVVTVVEYPGGSLVCLSCYAKGRTCAHTEAVADHIGARRAAA